MGKLVKMPRTAPPPKISNKDKRSREHLFPTEVTAMISAAKKVGRHELRDSTLILMAYRHGLRVSELVALRGEQIDFTPHSAPQLSHHPFSSTRRKKLN